MIREEDLLALQTAVLQAAVAKTVPGERFLDLAGFKEFVNPNVDDATLAEMINELVAEGILQPAGAGELRYCTTKEYLASVSDGK
ncbi:MAG: hypothetical protein ACM3ZC_11200 [Bacteroidota bacterium]